MEKLYYEDFPVGMVVEHHLQKTITEGDHSLFCLLTMNHHPRHHVVDISQANNGILVAGTYTASLVVGMTVPEISRHALATLRYNEINHALPVHIDDTLRAVSVVTKTREVMDPKYHRGIITIRTKGLNARGQIVIWIERELLMERRVEG